MRTIPSDALSLLNGKVAIESCIIVAVNWGNGYVLYSDKDITDGNGNVTVQGRIVELGTFDDVMKADQSGAASQVSIKLSDIDGELETIFNTVDIHLKDVQLYQWFVGLDLNSKFLILDGQINTPIEWNEGERTLSFDVVTKVEAFEIGFGTEEGNFPSVSPTLIGTPWPMLFGYVQHYPGLQLQEIPSAFTAEPFGVPDPALLAELSLIGSHVAALKAAQQAALGAAIAACWNEVWEGSLNGQNIFDVNCNDSPQVKKYNDLATQYGQQANQEQEQLNGLQNQYTLQVLWRRDSVKLIAQTNVTQSYSGVMRIGNNLYNGTLGVNGNLQEGRLNCTPILYQPISLNGDPTVDVQTFIQPQGFQFYNAGTQVQLAGPYPIAFVVSIVPGTVHQVWSYRSLNGLKQLVPVPASYYTVQTLDFGTVQAVCVVLKQPLSSIDFNQNLGIQNWENAFGQYLPSHLVPVIDWEDQVYVTFESSVGPNTCDIIQYLVDTYATGLTTDATSFNAVRTQLVNYPMNFGIASRDNVIQVIQDLAYQARCALWIKNSVVYIKYLPVEEDAVDTVTDDDIEMGTLVVAATPTEDLITKYIATYRPDYTPTYDQPVQLILRYNIKKYGVLEESHDFYAYRDFYEVQKSATFWMIRRANTFKLVRCKLLLNKLNLETFDTVTLNFAKPFVASGPVKALVNSAKYNSADNTIDAEFWVPVRFGEMVQYQFAWPAGLTEGNFFPPVHEITAGQSGGLNGGVTGVLPASNSLQINVAPIPNIFNNGGGLGNGYYQNDDLDLIPEIPDILPEPLPVEAPIMAPYRFPNLKDISVIPDAVSNAVYPCTVDEFKGFTDAGLQQYSCTAYPNGTANPGKTIPVVGQLQILRDARLPIPCWTHVCIVSWEDPTDSSKILRQATIQVPVWLK